MDVNEAVAQGADIFANAEESIDAIAASFGKPLHEVFATVRDAGHIGGIETQAYSARAAAMVATFKANVLQFHFELTEIAKEQGIDLPAPRSGGR
jgi:hypothetical protein